MSPQMIAQTCCIVGCSRPACDGGLHPEEAVCAEHARVGSPALLARLRTVSRRRQALDRIWSDEDRYDAVVGGGRYLKLCCATEAAMEQVDSAWVRLKLDLIVREAQARDAVEHSSRGQTSAAG